MWLPFRQGHTSDTRAVTSSIHDTLVDVAFPTGDAFLAVSDRAASEVSSFRLFLLLSWILGLTLIIDERILVWDRLVNRPEVRDDVTSPVSFRFFSCRSIFALRAAN